MSDDAPAVMCTRTVEAPCARPPATPKCRRRELACWLYDFVDQLRPLPPATRVYLSPEHNWAPVLHELQGSPVDVVEGQVPSDLRGAYLRTGERLSVAMGASRPRRDTPASSAPRSPPWRRDVVQAPTRCSPSRARTTGSTATVSADESG